MSIVASGGKIVQGLYDINVEDVLAPVRPHCLAFIAALWIWKIVEYSAKEAGWLNRNLGWGFYVNLTVPAIVTIAFLLIVWVRTFARLLVRRVSHRFVWAAITIVASLVLSNSVLAQRDPFMAVIGTVESVSGNLIHIRSGAQLLTLHVDDHTEVWKGKALRDLSQLEMGDDISARCRKLSGKLVAEAIWINIVNFTGVITKVNTNSFEVFTNPDADPQSAYRKENKFIRFDPDTVFQSGERDDLKLGRAVQIIGLDLRNGVILATRVWIYEGKRPVRMGKGKVIAPDGSTSVIDR